MIRADRDGLDAHLNVIGMHVIVVVLSVFVAWAGTATADRFARLVIC